MTERRSSRDHADHDLAEPSLEQHAQRGEWIEPGVEDDPTTDDDELAIVATIRSAVADARERASTAVEIARALPRPVQIAAAGVGGLLALALIRRITRGPARRARRKRAGGRVVRELGREVLGRAALAAATTLAARLTQDVLLPMLQEKLALQAERIAREPA